MTFTVSLSQYADPVLNQIDKNHIIKERLYRENCICHKGIFIKDLRKYWDEGIFMNFDFSLEPGKFLKEKMQFEKIEPEITIITPFYNTR